MSSNETPAGMLQFIRHALSFPGPSSPSSPTPHAMKHPPRPSVRSQPVALHLLEVGSMDQRLIGLSVERHMKHVLRLVSEPDQARAVLIDCDRQGAQDALRQARLLRGVGIVGYAFNPRERNNAFPGIEILNKPLALDRLPEALDRAIAAAGAAPPTIPADSPPPAAPPAPPTLGEGVQADDADLCGALEDLPPTPGAPLPDKAFFEPSDYLIGTLAQAVRTTAELGRPQAIAGLPRIIRIEPKPAPTCIAGYRDNQLRPLSMAQLPQSTARIVPAPSFQEHIAGEVACAAEELLWNVAAWGARGRIPAGHDPYRPVRLRAWPNFPAIFVSPHALRIAALWVRSHATPVEIASRLAIPQRYVFSFYSAAHFSGLLDLQPPPSTPAPVESAPQTERVPDTPVAPRHPAPSPQKPSLLSRILRKLLNAV